MKNLRHITSLITFFLVLSSGCSDGVTLGTSSHAIVQCVIPEDHGAIADDGLDDRVSLNAAIQAAQAGPGCLELGLGTYHASRIPLVGTSNIPSLRVTAPLIMRGQGPGSVVAMLGSGILPGKTVPSDWQLIQVTGAHVVISDMTLDGSERTNTIEQTHLLHFNSGTVNARVERVEFNLPSIGPSSGGDCIRLLGSVTNWVHDVSIVDSVGINCDRSFVGVQRAVDGFTLSRSETIVVGDQAVDLEPTGGSAFNCTPIVKDINIFDSTLRRGPNAPGDLTVAVAGDSCAVADDVLIRDTLIEDGSIFLVDTGRVELNNLNVKNRVTDNMAPLNAIKRVEDLRVIGGTYERVVGSTNGQVVKVTGQSGANPTRVTLLGVTVIQQVEGIPIYSESLASMVLNGCNVTYNGPESTTIYAVKNRGIDAPAGSPVLVDTTITGPLAGAAIMAGLTDGGSPVLVRVTGP